MRRAIRLPSLCLHVNSCGSALQQVGDIRVRVEIADTQDLTVICGRAYDSLVPYKTSNWLPLSIQWLYDLKVDGLRQPQVLMAYGQRTRRTSQELVDLYHTSNTGKAILKELAGTAVLWCCLFPLSEQIVELLPVLSPTLQSLGPKGFACSLTVSAALAISAVGRASSFLHTNTMLYLCAGCVSSVAVYFFG